MNWQHDSLFVTDFRTGQLLKISVPAGLKRRSLYVFGNNNANPQKIVGKIEFWSRGSLITALPYLRVDAGASIVSPALEVSVNPSGSLGSPTAQQNIIWLINSVLNTTVAPFIVQADCDAISLKIEQAICAAGTQSYFLGCLSEELP